jgi:uncharacterized membrane-anchored protein YhcB (DUF1043 family)|tara:strand:+ start:2207 stop:2416 length:210 start_codon:yes stop_codon:yes gene_type:complete
MEIGEIHLLFIIAVSLVLGVLIGFVITTLLIQRENKGLNNELDKFRALYFNELDKWKNKYTNNDDYEAY